MATGGFKAFEYELTTNSENQNAFFFMSKAVKSFVKAVTQGIIAADSDWGYDSDFTATADDYVQIGSESSYYYQACFAQFLVNSTTHSKLLVYYNPAGKMKVNLQGGGCQRTNINGAQYYAWGLCMSMLPGNSEQTWDTSSNCTTYEFIPGDATIINGTALNDFNANITSASDFTALNSNSSTTVRFVFIVKGDFIAYFWQQKNSGNFCGGRVLGKIFSELCNASDNIARSQYGCIGYADPTSSGGVINELTDTYSANLNSRTNWIGGTNSHSGYTPSISEQSCLYDISFSSADRSRFPYPFIQIESSIGYSYCRQMAINPLVYSGSLTNSDSSNKTAFSPYLLYLDTNNLNNFYVAQDTAFKGYLDTDIFRAVYTGLPFNTLLDDGNFIYVGGGLAIGWDSTNEVILRT